MPRVNSIGLRICRRPAFLLAGLGDIHGSVAFQVLSAM